ncbi:unnamed protein product [Oncorhynchus mykiss]|uniref:D-ribitol-5-phosphate cytidylyltransferase C-terminal domain-containing protein n=1 Tax=Oncorhynchus mykiss TaxID=8022 RepID=A0A060ZE09_ONCMY|nr:unnamed protein product [Oncorhynchus mykiss]
MGDDAKSLSKEWNFIRVSVNSSCFSEVGKMLSALEEADRALLHPVVIIWVSSHGDVCVNRASYELSCLTNTRSGTGN